jgi:hypothetical protein
VVKSTLTDELPLMASGSMAASVGDTSELALMPCNTLKDDTKPLSIQACASAYEKSYRIGEWLEDAHVG